MPTRTLRPARKSPPAALQRVPGLSYAALDEFVGFALRRAQIATFADFYRGAAGSGLTPPRFTALLLVGGNPGLRQTLLGEALGIARSGAMLLTDWLEARGLVERRASPDDGRAWGLFLTGSGKRVLDAVKHRVGAEDRRRMQRLSLRERRQLKSLLERIAD